MADRRLFASSLLTVAEFVCPPSDEAWNDLNEIGDRPIVVFPRVPVAIRVPSRIGSWPEVYTWDPLRTAGTYAATGLATSGTASPSSASRSSGVLTGEDA